MNNHKTNTMNTAQTLEQLKELRLNGMADSYQSILQLPIDKHPEGHELIASLIFAEQQYRQQQRTVFLLRRGHLRYRSALENVHCSVERNFTKQQLTQLADCSFISRAENVLITGATGSGKSYLACALGHQACLYGHKTLYLNMSKFCEKIQQARIEGTMLKLYSKMEKVKLLVLDDFGLQPLDHQVKLSLLQILEDRHGIKSTIISSQLPIAKWYEYLAEPTLADAIMDRMTASAHKIELKGKSLRKKQV